MGPDGGFAYLPSAAGDGSLHNRCTIWNECLGRLTDTAASGIPLPPTLLFVNACPSYARPFDLVVSRPRGVEHRNRRRNCLEPASNGSTRQTTLTREMSVKTAAATVRKRKMSSRRRVPVHRAIVSVAVGGIVTLLIVGCRHSETAAPAPPSTSPEATPAATSTTSPSPTCEGVERPESDLLASYRIKGNELRGDVDGDGKEDGVTLRADETRPARCRYLVVVEFPTGSAIAATVKPLSFGTDPSSSEPLFSSPKLLLLADIDGRPGLEPVIALAPAAVYRPGAVFMFHDGELIRMRLRGAAVHPELFPFYDEFPAGVDCGGERGTIVVTFGGLAEKGRDDRHWDITRSVYRAAGSRFELIGEEEFRVDVGPEAERRWPELGGDPFPSCPGRVG